MESTSPAAPLAEISPHYVRLLHRVPHPVWCEMQLTRRSKIPEETGARFAAGLPARLFLRPADFTLTLDPAAPSGGFGADRRGLVVPAAPDRSAGWLVASAGDAAIAAGTGALAELGIQAAPAGFSPLAALRALQQFAAARPEDGPILALDLGGQSHAVLVEADGVDRLEAFPELFDSIAGVVQERLGLNFRGAAMLLFFNEFYDFAEHASAIVAPCVDALRPTLECWQAAGMPRPRQLAIPGVLGGQSWFTNALAAALDLTPFAPPIQTLLAGVGGEIDPLPAAAAPLLALWSASVQPHDPWLAAPSVDIPEVLAAAPLTPVPGLASGVTDLSAAAAAAPENGVRALPNLPSLPEFTGLPPDFTLPTPVPGAQPLLEPVPQTAVAAEPVPVAHATVTAEAAPEAAAASLAAAAEENAAVPPAVLAAASLLQQPEISGAAAAEEPVSTPPPVALPRLESAPAAPVRPVGTKGRPIWQFAVVACVVALLVGAGGWFWFASNLEAERQAALAAAEQARQEAEKRQREIEERIRAEEEARARAEAAAAAAQREAEAIAARAAAEASALQAAAAAQIQARARGAVRIRTEPEGALVRIGNGPAQPSPVTVPNLPTGRHTVRIALADFEPVETVVEVVADQVAEPAPVRLVRSTGSLAVVSDPPGLPVEVFVADSLFLSEPIRRDVTPATFADLPVGAFRVRVVREGWPVHEQRTEISRQSHSSIVVDLRGTELTLQSRPAGAQVRRDGQSLGTTPLVLPDQPPGAHLFRFELDGHYEEELLVETGGLEPISRQVRLLSYREPAASSDIDQPPVPIRQVAPRINDVPNESMRNFEIVVDRDGRVVSARAVDAPEDNLSRACIDALRQWTFEPARSRGRPVPVRLVVPIRFGQ